MVVALAVANTSSRLTSLLSASASVPRGLGQAVDFLSLYGRFVPFLSAQLSLANVLFYLLFCLCMLALAAGAEYSGRMRRT